MKLHKWHKDKLGDQMLFGYVLSYKNEVEKPFGYIYFEIDGKPAPADLHMYCDNLDSPVFYRGDCVQFQIGTGLDKHGQPTACPCYKILSISPSDAQNNIRKQADYMTDKAIGKYSETSLKNMLQSVAPAEPKRKNSWFDNPMANIGVQDPAAYAEDNAAYAKKDGDDKPSASAWELRTHTFQKINAGEHAEWGECEDTDTDEYYATSPIPFQTPNDDDEKENANDENKSWTFMTKAGKPNPKEEKANDQAKEEKENDKEKVEKEKEKENTEKAEKVEEETEKEKEEKAKQEKEKDAKANESENTANEEIENATNEDMAGEAEKQHGYMFDTVITFAKNMDSILALAKDVTEMKKKMLTSNTSVAELKDEVNDLKDEVKDLKERLTQAENEKTEYIMMIQQLVTNLAKPSVLHNAPKAHASA